MAFSRAYDPDTLAFLADQAAHATGKKHYNPVPRSRIPSSPRHGGPRRQPAASPAPPHPSLFSQLPVYFVSVFTGQEALVVGHLNQSPGVHAFTPRDAQGRAMLPGTVFVAVSADDLPAVRERLRHNHWGRLLSGAPADPDLVRPFLPYADANALADADSAVGPGPSHPLRQLAEALLQSRGWHGRLEAKGWALRDRHGNPATDTAFDTLWQALVADWNAGRPFAEMLARHGQHWIGTAFAIEVTHDHQPKWIGRWLEQTVIIPPSHHANIHLTSTTAWGVLTSTTPLTFSLCHPDLARQRLHYRLPYDALARVPGKWAAILVPRVNSVVQGHVRQTAQSLGWVEHWRAVTPHDPAALLTTVLRPRRLRFDQAPRKVAHVQGIPADRIVWADEVQRWLPEWCLDIG